MANSELNILAEVVNEMAENAARFAARRIAKLSKSCLDSAQRDYQQHTSQMTDAERAEFNSMIAQAAMEC